MVHLFFDVVGTIGVILILLAYFLIQTEKLTSDNLWYPGLNLAGAVLLLTSLYWTPNVPSIIIEICWMAISIYGIITILRRKT
jgi:hypothetical protein